MAGWLILIAVLYVLQAGPWIIYFGFALWFSYFRKSKQRFNNHPVFGLFVLVPIIGFLVIYGHSTFLFEKLCRTEAGLRVHGKPSYDTSLVVSGESYCSHACEAVLKDSVFKYVEVEVNKSHEQRAGVPAGKYRFSRRDVGDKECVVESHFSRSKCLAAKPIEAFSSKYELHVYPQSFAPTKNIYRQRLEITDRSNSKVIMSTADYEIFIGIFSIPVAGKLNGVWQECSDRKKVRDSYAKARLNPNNAGELAREFRYRMLGL